MPDWKSIEEIQREVGAFIKFMHVLLGIYAYEWFLSLDFEWDFISGKKKFRWPLIFYFSGRYLLLFAMIGIVIALDTTTEINCQALYTFNQLAGNAAVGMASINLSIRTMAVWSQNRYIIGLLVILILGHWSLILQGVLLTAVWVPNFGCAITTTNNKILAATFIYSMCFDLCVLVLNAYKLSGVSSKNQGFGTSKIAKMIFEDGLIFFMIAFIANLIATVFMLLDLNQIMSVIFNVPAAVGSTIVASRVVRRLTNFTNQGPEVYGATTSQSGNINFRAPAVAGARGMNTIGSFKGVQQHGVHVKMETFVKGEPVLERDLPYDSSKSGESIRDASDKDFDIEAKGQPL